MASGDLEDSLNLLHTSELAGATVADADLQSPLERQPQQHLLMIRPGTLASWHMSILAYAQAEVSQVFLQVLLTPFQPEVSTDNNTCLTYTAPFCWHAGPTSC